MIDLADIATNFVSSMTGFLKLAVLIAVFSMPSWGAFSLVQHPTNGGCATATTCTITLTQNLGAGNLAVIVGATQNDVTISSINQGGGLTLCASSACHKHCSGCTPTVDVDAAFIPVTTSGVGTIQITWSGITGGAAIWVGEFTSAGVSFDTAAVSSATPPACTNCTGPAFSLTGTNDLVVSYVNLDAGTINSFGAPYNTAPSPDIFSSNSVAVAWIMNTTSTTQATWVQSSSQKNVAGVLALMEAPATRTHRPLQF